MMKIPTICTCKVKNRSMTKAEFYEIQKYRQRSKNRHTENSFLLFNVLTS